MQSEDLTKSDEEFEPNENDDGERPPNDPMPETPGERKGKKRSHSGRDDR